MPLPSEHRPPELAGTQTHAHLAAAYARDAQVARLLDELARIARIEGYPAVSRALAEMGETASLLAGGHLDFLRRVGEPLADAPLGGTPENVAALVRVARVDLAEHLPAGVSTSNAEGFPDIASWFETVAATRRAHLARLEALLGALAEPG